MILLAAISLLALLFPSAFETYRKRLADHGGAEAIEPAAPLVAAKAAAPPAPAPAPAPAGRRVARLQADASGHFRTRAEINGQPVEVLVDTGATFVAMNEAVARRLGIRLSPADYSGTVETANGRAPVARARLDRIRIGTVEVREVDVLVTPGEGLRTTLLGMSFLNRLKRFGIEDGRLDLVE